MHLQQPRKLNIHYIFILRSKRINALGLAQIYNKVPLVNAEITYIKKNWMQTIETIETVKPSEQPGG